MRDEKNKLLDDLTGLATGLGIAAQGVREEVEQAMRSRIDAILSENNMVTREEFEAVRDMAVAAREENAALRAELDALKKKK
ncbi:MAG: pyrroline-5-carboxylate reductase [Rhodobiaceae bacterium]|jgi:BMFP domain-containing protein YqiC|nr:pyrroline-5-carboxylate reductase [Rhodobiaceae bacterium]|tara:strand:+ start:1255 stop:1500 length:246 start_codon:yes stop_codon:yes gene_type:complete